MSLAGSSSETRVSKVHQVDELCFIRARCLWLDSSTPPGAAPRAYHVSPTASGAHLPVGVVGVQAPYSAVKDRWLHYPEMTQQAFAELCGQSSKFMYGSCVLILPRLVEVAGPCSGGPGSCA